MAATLENGSIGHGSNVSPLAPDQRAVNILEERATPLSTSPSNHDGRAGSVNRAGTARPRSRRGCLTCRKRKVKCDEVHPACGHCHRLQLSCNYETLDSDSQHPAGKRQKKSQKPYLPSGPSQSAQLSLSTFASSPQISPHQRLGTEQFQAVNNSRAQSVNFEQDVPQEYDESLARSYVPSMGYEAPIANQRLSGLDNWELELLGEDSLWANIPILSNFISVQNSPPYEYVASSEFMQTVGYSTPSNTVAPSGIVAGNGVGSATASAQRQELFDLGNFNPIDEITLLRHFVDFAVPPILIGVEPRWNISRDALLRLSKSSLPLRHSICAFSALSLGESPGGQISSTTKTSSFYFELAMKELDKVLEDQVLPRTSVESHESILAGVFFLSYVEVIVSNIPKSSVDLLDRAHTLLKTKDPSTTPLYNQLQIWLKLLDAKVVSAGGKGIHLHTNPDTQDLDVVRESYGSSNGDQNGSSDADASVLETEEILFNSLNRPAYNFYLQVLNFSGRIARLDKWHRSRGSVQDEMEVMLAADKIVRDLNALWTRRPAIIDLADKSEQLQKYMTGSLAVKIEAHLRTYAANFHACFIHLQRVAYAHLKAISQVKPAVSKIVRLSRMSIEEGSALPVSMLWPLMMAACEAEEEDTQEWIIGMIEGMNGKVGNATRTAKLVTEIVKRQKSGQRADARTVMQEAFGEVFAII